ncbi:MAG: hypothetical protein V9H69_06820 [Anaerolineae bacterium]
MSDPGPNFAQWILLLSLAIYGLWIGIKGWQQFRHPDGTTPFGLGLMINWNRGHTTDRSDKPSEDAWTQPGLVRFWGVLLMTAGGVALLLPVFIFLITKQR